MLQKKITRYTLLKRPTPIGKQNPKSRKNNQEACSNEISHTNEGNTMTNIYRNESAFRLTKISPFCSSYSRNLSIHFQGTWPIHMATQIKGLPSKIRQAKTYHGKSRKCFHQ